MIYNLAWFLLNPQLYDSLCVVHRNPNIETQSHQTWVSCICHPVQATQGFSRKGRFILKNVPNNGCFTPWYGTFTSYLGWQSSLATLWWCQKPEIGVWLRVSGLLSVRSPRAPWHASPLLLVSVSAAFIDSPPPHNSINQFNFPVGSGLFPSSNAWWNLSTRHIREQSPQIADRVNQSQAALLRSNLKGSEVIMRCVILFVGAH